MALLEFRGHHTYLWWPGRFGSRCAASERSPGLPLDRREEAGAPQRPSASRVTAELCGVAGGHPWAETRLSAGHPVPERPNRAEGVVPPRPVGLGAAPRILPEGRRQSGPDGSLRQRPGRRQWLGIKSYAETAPAAAPPPAAMRAISCPVQVPPAARIQYGVPGISDTQAKLMDVLAEEICRLAASQSLLRGCIEQSDLPPFYSDCCITYASLNSRAALALAGKISLDPIPHPAST